MKKYLVLLLLSYSSVTLSGGVWTPAGKIATMDEYGSGLRISGLDVSSNPAGCKSAGTALAISNADSVAQNRLNSILLSAFMANKAVQVKLSDNYCEANFPAYYAVRISN